VKRRQERIMSQTTAHAVERVPRQTAGHPDGTESPARAFANGLLLALPLWGLIGLVVWAIAA
jgi:hypothetical protein